MRKIEIARKPSINQALKDELALKEKMRKTRRKTWDDMYNIDDIYDTTDWKEWMGNYGIENDYDNDDYNYDDYQGYYDTSYVDKQEKEIYFYEKLDLTDNGYEDTQYDNVFFNIAELKDFCKENGINISKGELEAIKYRNLNYCTFDPIDKKEGELTLISDSSFGGLWWECHDIDEELMNEKKERNNLSL